MFDCTGSDVFHSIFEFHLFSDKAGEITIDSKDQFSNHLFIRPLNVIQMNVWNDHLAEEMHS